MSAPPEHPGEPEPFITIKELAEHLGVSERTIARWRNQGAPAHKPIEHGAVRYRLSEINAWLADPGYRRKGTVLPRADTTGVAPDFYRQAAATLTNELVGLVRQHLDDAEALGPFMDADSAAAYLDCSRSALLRLVDEHELPHHVVAGRVVFSRRQLDRYVAHGSARAA